MQTITLVGGASKKEYPLIVNKQDASKKLMHYLQEQQFPIASSCLGKGLCRKCVVNTDLLSCSLTVEEFMHQTSPAVVTVTYL